MRAAFAAIYGVEDGFRDIEFAGRSDLAIIEDALAGVGVTGDAVKAAIRQFKRAYYGHLPRTLLTNNGSVFPGVRDLLEVLSSESQATLSLGTGNFRRSAGMKLSYFGLHTYFKAGGFGDRTGDRPTLVAQGIRAANRLAGKHSTVFVIGDTVHDMRAAKDNGAVAVGVETGGTTEADLCAAGADVVLPTLETAARFLVRTSS